MDLFKKNYSKEYEKSKKEYEYLKSQIEEEKKYLSNINNDIKSLLDKKRILEKEYETLRINYGKLNDQYHQMYKEVNKYTIDYVDSLDGINFEKYIAEMLPSIGYTDVELTKASNDYGVDIVAEKDNIRYAIQCKNYSSPLGNSCVQEIYSGKNYYNCHVAVVITNSTFTKNARELAKKDGVLLWDRNYLINLIEKYAVNNNKIISVTTPKTINLNKYNNTDTSKYDDYESKEEYDDPLYNDVVDFAIEATKISATLIERKYHIGYNRAAKLIDLLEERGIIGEQQGSKPRDVLIKK